MTPTTPSRHAELIVDGRNTVGESPVWMVTEQALYWVDIPARKIHRWSLQSHSLHEWPTQEMVGSIAPSRAGGWICAMESGIFRLRLANDGNVDCVQIIAVEHPRPRMRFNDGRCDRQGRFIAGTMQKDMTLGEPVGTLQRYSRSRGMVQLQDNLVVPNGLAFSPDGTTMYLSDSHPSVQLIWAFDYDVRSGTPSNRRLFVDMKPLPGRPDGAAVDEDGCYWICGNDAGLVHRFTPKGKLDRSLALPAKQPSKCAFGGPQLDTLFVTTIRPIATDLSDQPHAGGVFALQPGVRGLPEPSCAY